MTRDLPSKPAPSHLPSTAKRLKSTRFQFRKHKPVYKLPSQKVASPKEPLRTHGENKENLGAPNYSSLLRRGKADWPERRFLRDVKENGPDAGKPEFRLKTSEVEYEQESIFGGMFVKDTGFLAKKETEFGRVAGSEILTNGDACKTESCPGQDRRSKAYPEEQILGTQTANVGKQSETGNSGLDSISPHLNDENQKKVQFNLFFGKTDFKEALRPSGKKDFLVGNLNSVESQKNEEKSSEPLEFVRPFTDILMEINEDDNYLDEAFLCKSELFDSLKTNENVPNLVTNEKNCIQTLEDDSVTKRDGFLGGNDGEEGTGSKVPAACFLDEPVEESPRKTGTRKDKENVPRNKQRKSISLKEKFKKLNRLKKTCKHEKHPKSKLISKPFHPSIQKKSLFLKSKAFCQNNQFYAKSNQVNYISGRFSSPSLDMQQFPKQMMGLPYMRQPLKPRMQGDLGFYRSEFGFRKHSDHSSDKTEEYSNKYKTEICKNFELTGTCQWGEMVIFGDYLHTHPRPACRAGGYTY